MGRMYGVLGSASEALGCQGTGRGKPETEEPAQKNSRRRKRSFKAALQTPRCIMHARFSRKREKPEEKEKQTQTEGWNPAVIIADSLQTHTCRLLTLHMRINIINTAAKITTYATFTSFGCTCRKSFILTDNSELDCVFSNSAPSADRQRNRKLTSRWLSPWQPRTNLYSNTLSSRKHFDLH